MATTAMAGTSSSERVTTNTHRKVSYMLPPTPTSSILPRQQAIMEDPDEVFSRRTITEVKTVLHKLRADADAKQEELRLMVGERYRDLIQASTSIIEISDLSTNVEQLLRKMEAKASVQGKETVMSGVTIKFTNDDDQLQALQCLAAHVKLLIDASEHLWRFLERRRYLHAAWLFLLCRVVHRSLVHADEESMKPWTNQGISVMDQFPIVQRQWDSLSQFRAQISHKATLSLRDQTIDAPDVSGAILALHLLDSLPFMDGLDLLLKQRSRNLATLLENREENKPPSSLKRMNSKKFDDGSENEIWSAIRRSLDALSRTVGTVRHAFRDGDPPLIMQLLRFTQDESYPPDSIPSEVQISTSVVLASLPGGTIFTSLPPEIKSYRPFIDVKSSSANIDRQNVASRLRSWLMESCTKAKDTIQSWLRKVATVRDLWNINELATAWLRKETGFDEEDKEYMSNLFSDVCRIRIEEVFVDRLNDMSSSFAKAFDEAIKSLRNDCNESSHELEPSKFLLSAPPAPSLALPGLGPQRAEASLQRFRLSIKHRIDGLTPAIDVIHSNVETAGKSLRSDLDVLAQNSEFFNSLQKSYLAAAETALNRILDHIKSALDKSIASEAESLSQIVFCGRIAYVFSNSAVTSHLLCSDAFKTAFLLRTKELHAKATNRWTVAVSSKAGKRFLVRKRETASQVPSRPSATLTNLLRSFTSSVNNWGFHRDTKHRSCLVRDLIAEFSDEICNGLQHLSKPVPPSMIYDLRFMRYLCSTWGEPLAKATNTIDERLREITKTDLPFEPLSLDEEVLSQRLTQMSLFLAPILPNLASHSVKTMKSPTTRVSERQPSASKIRDSPEDDSPVLHLAKPSSRFGSLWVSEQ